MHVKFFKNLNDSQTFKSSSCKKSFLQCVCYKCNLLRRMFFVPCDNWKTLFFLRVCRYCEIFSTALPFSLKQVFWKKFESLMLMLSSKIKVSYTRLIQTWKTVVADFFMIKFFTFFILWSSLIYNASARHERH